MRLKGKRAFISGAGSGIGEAAALKFAAEGARVILADIRSPAVEAVAARIVAAGGEARGGQRRYRRPRTVPAHDR